MTRSTKQNGHPAFNRFAKAIETYRQGRSGTLRGDPGAHRNHPVHDRYRPQAGRLVMILGRLGPLLAVVLTLCLAGTAQATTTPGFHHLAKPQNAVITGSWVGSYSCAQGPTGLRLAIQNPTGNILTAIFAFYPLTSNQSIPRGSFAMTGHYEGDRLTLTPSRWIDHPPEYSMVELEGQLQGATLTGSIISRGCGAFSVSKVNDASVAVVADGYSQLKSASGTVIDFGVELRNNSLTMDGLNIVVTTSFVDKYGRSVVTDSHNLTAIPAGGTFYYAGFAESNISLIVARMDVVLKTSATRKKGIVVPPVSEVRTTPGGFGEESITGQVTNPYNSPIPSDATIYAVFFNALGKIVGGAFEFSGATLEPKAAVSFNLSEYPPTEVVRARISVDPCDWLLASIGAESCPVSVTPTVRGPFPGGLR